MGFGVFCKGDWRLGTACRKCSRCFESAPKYIEYLENELIMYKEGWHKVLGGVLISDSNSIRHSSCSLILYDALVLTTRRICEELSVYKEKERMEQQNAALKVRDECVESWEQAYNNWQD